MAVKIEAGEKARVNFWALARDRVRTAGGAQQLILQPVIRTLSWIEWFHEELSANAVKCKKIFSQTNKILFLVDIPKNMEKAARAMTRVKSCLAGRDFSGAAKAGASSAAFSVFVVGTCADTVKMCHMEKIFSLTSAQLQVIEMIGFIGGVALFGVTCKGLVDQVRTIQRFSYGDPEFTLAMIKIVSKVSLLAVVVFGLFPLLVPTWVKLLAGSVLLLGSISSYFYEQMYVHESENSLDL